MTMMQVKQKLYRKKAILPESPHFKKKIFYKEKKLKDRARRNYLIGYAFCISK
jgi:hypothetical protein